MSTLGFFSVCLFLVVSSGVSFLEHKIPNVKPEVLDALLQEKEFDLVSKLLKIENANLVRPSEGERSLNPMFNEELEFGDILLTKEQQEEARQGIKFTRYPGSKWPNRNVPYYISSDFIDREKSIILDGINTWNRKVECVKLNPYNGEDDYVMIINGKGCYSYLGRTGGQQALSLQRNGCLYTSTILHEFYHAIGTAHEQNRSDRDDYIEMLWENIPERWKSQYKKTNTRDYGLQQKYDYYSVMHYRVNAPGTNKPAFRVKKSGIDEERIGRGSGFTRTDLDKISQQYC